MFLVAAPNPPGGNALSLCVLPPQGVCQRKGEGGEPKGFSQAPAATAD